MEINEEQSDYENASENRRGRTRTKRTPHSGGDLYRLGVLTLGLMCILQATLNVSLRLILYNDREQLHASNIKLTEERDRLKMENGRLNDRIRGLKEERPCPQEWKKFGNSCYYTSTEEYDWEHGRQDCLHRGADLVVINSREEQKFINGIYARDDWVWIGLSDREAEKTWTWVDGTPLTTTYWGKGQPNYDGGDQDCVHFIHLGPDELGEWSDEVCSAEFRWICEK